MRKMLSGILIGVVLSISSTIYAEEVKSLIGKVVEGTFPLKIDGKRAEKDVLVIDGTSYIPVRAASELFGYSVLFDPEGEVVLTKIKEEKVLTKETTPQESEQRKPEDYEALIQVKEGIIWGNRGALQMMKPDDPRRVEIEETIRLYEAEIEQLQIEKAQSSQ